MTIFLKTCRKGYQFSSLWPKNEPYLVAFAQTRAVKLADLTLTVAPAIAFVTVYLQFRFLGLEVLNLALAMSLLILSLPLHGYFILGQQAQQRLPAGLQGWYREIEQKLKSDGIRGEGREVMSPDHPKANHKLTYLDLAKLLKTLFERK